MANLQAFGDKIMGGASTGGGHTIWNRIKTALTQRPKLWFKDATVSDVSADGASAVEVITSVSESDFDNLPTDGTADGMYEMNSSNVTPLMADNIGYGNGTVKDAVDDVKGNLLIEQLLTTTQTEYSLSEAYTNYKYLLLEVYDGTYIRGSACADSTLFNNVGGVVVPYFGGGNTYNASVKKVSSTSLKISCESGLIVTIRIYGIIAP
jgi:hypothetical protein